MGTGFHGRVHVIGAALLEGCQQKRRLGQRLASAEGHAAPAAPKALVAPQDPHQLVHGINATRHLQGLAEAGRHAFEGLAALAEAALNMQS